MYDELRKLTVPQLKKIIREYNRFHQITKYSTLNKEALIDRIMTYNNLILNMLNPKVNHSINIDDFNIVKVKKTRVTKAQRQRQQMEIQEQQTIPVAMSSNNVGRHPDSIHHTQFLKQEKYKDSPQYKIKRQQ